MSEHGLKIFDPNKITPGESLSGVIYRCDICGRRFRWNHQHSSYYGTWEDDARHSAVSCGCGKLTIAEAKAIRERKQAMQFDRWGFLVEKRSDGFDVVLKRDFPIKGQTE